MQSGVLPIWMERWLGIEAGSGEGTQWGLESSWSWAPWVTLLFVFFVACWMLYFTMKESPSVSRRVKLLLVSIRMALVGLLLFMIAEYMISLQRTGLPYVVVLVDESASMGVVDRYPDELLAERLRKRLKKVGLESPTRINLAKMLLVEDDARLLHQVAQKHKLRVYFLAGASRLQGGSVDEVVTQIKSLEATGERSRLGVGLRSVLSDLRGTPPAAIVVLTDGVTTDGETLSEAAGYARRKGVPLLTVGLGSDDPTRDLELSDLLVDEIVFVDDVVNFQGTLKATGYEGQQAELVLREKGNRKVLARTKVTLGPNGEPQQVRLPYRPDKVGEFEYVVEIQHFDDESQTENNQRSRMVSVRKEQIRVLMIQAYPSYEFRYLKHMLQRDTTIELSTVLQEADKQYAELDKSARQMIPVRREELFTYDVIIFGDVEPHPAFLSSSTMDNLRAFVQERGGGIIFLAGPRYTPLAYGNTPLASLFPVYLDSTVTPPEGESITEGFTPLPTDLGMASPHMQLGENAQETLSIWRKLPSLYWMLECAELKPTVRVLAEHPTRLSASGRKLPVFMMHYAGAGKVLFHATDETWRWRYRIGDVLFARYWVQSIRYLARSKLLGSDRNAEMTVDRREYRRGEPVRIRVRFVDERTAPSVDDGVAVVIEQKGNKSRRMKLHRTSASRGVFEGVFTGASEGNFHVYMVAPSPEGKAPSADFLVTAPPGEFQRVRMDVAELARAAEKTRGKFYRIQTASNLLNDLPDGRQVPFESLPPEVLWNQWWVLSLFLGLLITEWILRKRKGLL